MFIHLHCHSAYSLCQGAIKIKDFPRLCEQEHMPAVAITDLNNLFGAMEFSIKCADKGIQPIIGCTVTVRHNNASYPLVLLCASQEGYKNLSHLITRAYTYEKLDYQTVTLEDVWSYQKGLICLSGYEKGLIGSLLLKKKKEDALTVAKDFLKHFQDRFYFEICRHGLKEQNILEPTYLKLALDLNIPLVATNEVYFPKQDMFEAHDALRCIAEGRYVVETNRVRLNDHYYFKSSEEMEKLFDDLPEAVEHTVVIAKRCQFFLKPSRPQLPPYPAKLSEKDLLRKNAKTGLTKRLKEEGILKNLHQHYLDRLDYELDVIESMGFPGYFLIVADFIQWSKAHDIPVGPGRGSGAGSVVAWALTITDMDPIKYGLLFERFLNPERVSMPDFDIDFCQERRDEVIAYVRKKYGDQRVAHIITFGTLQTKGVLRDVGRVLSMPYSLVDQIVRTIPFQIASIQEALETVPEFAAFHKEDEVVQKLVSIASQLEGLYRHASTHAAGVVIGGCDLQDIVPLYREEDSSIFSTQFSMKYVEMAGLLKFDFLGLKTLTVIHDAVELIQQQHSVQEAG